MAPKRSDWKNKGGLTFDPEFLARVARMRADQPAEPAHPAQPAPPANRGIVVRPFRDPYPTSFIRQGPYLREALWPPFREPIPNRFTPQTAQTNVLTTGESSRGESSNKHDSKSSDKDDGKGPTSAAIEAFARQAGAERQLGGSSLPGVPSSSSSTIPAVPGKKRKLTSDDNATTHPAPKRKATLTTKSTADAAPVPTQQPTGTKRKTTRPRTIKRAIKAATTTTQPPTTTAPTFRDKTSTAPVTGRNGFRLLHPQPVFKKGVDGTHLLTMRYIDDSKTAPQSTTYNPRGALANQPLNYSSDADISRLNNWVCQFLRRRGCGTLRGDMTERVWSAEEVEWLRREVRALREGREWKTKRELVVELTKRFNGEWEGKGVEVVKAGETVEVARGARSEQAVQTRGEKEGLLDGVGRKKKVVVEVEDGEDGEDDDEEL